MNEEMNKEMNMLDSDCQLCGREKEDQRHHCFRDVFKGGRGSSLVV